jgi:hypothetical protein
MRKAHGSHNTLWGFGRLQCTRRGNPDLIRSDSCRRDLATTAIRASIPVKECKLYAGVLISKSLLRFLLLVFSLEDCDG